MYARNAQLFLLEDLDGNRDSRPLTPESLQIENPSLSAAGDLLAYRSDESGQWRVYVQDFPELSWRRAVFTGLGNEPVWARDGADLFFRSRDELLKVSVETGPTLTLGEPQRLFAWPWVLESGQDYDVSLDGERILMVREGGPGTDDGSLVVVQNWLEELDSLARAN